MNRIVIIALLFSASVLHAEPVIYGRVADAKSGEGLLGVNLQLTEALRGTSSNADGRYHLRVPAAGTWTVRISHIGYRRQQQTFTIAEDESLRVDLRLVSDFLPGDEVVVTALARESTARLATTRVEVVGAAEVEERSPGTLDRALDGVPGLEAHRTGGPVVSNLSIRGSSDMLGGGVGNRTLLLVDGKPAIISDTDGASWWLYPDDIIERVEVVKGAYSALYGSNAMGGVVNLLTRSSGPREFTRLHATYGMYQRPPEWMRYTERLRQTAAATHLDTDIDGQGPLTYVPKWRLFYSASLELGKLLLSGDAAFSSEHAAGVHSGQCPEHVV
ncbi:MAG: TonB-dependent receptor plug domain-containing protein [bacterium]|nr:TonB-dependent receptor plug domain-containing protein [bacterium]